MTEPAPTSRPADARPVVRLKPKHGGRFFAGAPWVYGDEIVADRRTRALAPGTLAELQDGERTPLGLVAVNPGATLAARLLDRDPGAEIDRDWIAARLTAALALRRRFFDTPHFRLVHAEADGLPGVVIDLFGTTAVLQPNAAWADARAELFADALAEVAGAETVILNAGSRARSFDGLDAETRVLRGAMPEGPLEVPMNGATYLADLAEGQKTGLFYDQRPNHAAFARAARGGRVLDVFAHVGGFGLAALAAGATHALAVDGSAPALALADGGAAATGVADRFETRRGDAFDVMRALAEAGETFDAVVCDPPAFAPSRSAVDAGLRAYRKTARLAAPLVAPGGILCLCSCSHAVGAEAFVAACAAGLRGADRDAALLRRGGAGPDHPVHPALAETSYLKADLWTLR